MPARPALAAVLVASLLASPLAIGTAFAASPSTVPAGFVPGSVAIVLEPFADGFDQPVFVTPDGTGDGLLYVVEQTGAVRVLSQDGSVAPEPFLDLRGRISAGGEEGLLGLAFHPDYLENGRLFVYYSVQGGGAQVVTELHARDGVVDPSSEREVLQMADFASNHNGGMLAFDHDGMLLIGTGDGGGGGDPEDNGQDDTQLLGKLLRIDVDTQQLAQELGVVLAVVLGIAAAPTVAGADEQHPVVVEGKHPAVVVAREVGHLEHLALG
jgi:glucose/arabinose dehydrogenase